MELTWTFSGSRLRLLREMKGMEVADCAKALGVAGHQWKSWEEDRVEPGARTVAKMCTLLGAPNAIFCWSGGDK